MGEVLWDVFPDATRLGGAPLNFGVHARRLGHEVCLVSAVGADELGREAARAIAALDVDTTFLKTTERFPTGTARVEFNGGKETSFTIERPAAYDAVRISDDAIEQLQNMEPGWLYYGTLFASTPQGLRVLDRLIDALNQTLKFYDPNLRPSADSPQLVERLMISADIVKLNEDELRRVQEFSGLPHSIEAFCHEGAARYGWKAVAVTLGDRGSAILVDGRYVEAEGCLVDVTDTVGAGDAYAAAFMHGLDSRWPPGEVAAFANRVGALITSREGAIPDWTLEEAVKL